MPLLVCGYKLRYQSKLSEELQPDISIKNRFWKRRSTSCRENNHSCPEEQLSYSKWILLNCIRTSKANTRFLKRKRLYNLKAMRMPLKPSEDHLLTKGRHWWKNNYYPSKQKYFILLCHYTNEKGTDARHRLTGPRRRGHWRRLETSQPEKATLSQQIFWRRKDGGHQQVLGRTCLRLQRSQGRETLA